MADHSARLSGPPLTRGEMAHLIALNRVRYLLDNPKALQAYQRRNQGDKHEKARAALARAARQGAGHG